MSPTWERFFDRRSRPAPAGFAMTGQDVVDFGCGYGTFTDRGGAPMTTGSRARHRRRVPPWSPRPLRVRRRSASETSAPSSGTSMPKGRAARRLGRLCDAVQRAARRGTRCACCGRPDASSPPGGVLAVIHWVHDRGDAARPRARHSPASGAVSRVARAGRIRDPDSLRPVAALSLRAGRNPDMTVRIDAEQAFDPVRSRHDGRRRAALARAPIRRLRMADAPILRSAARLVAPRGRA